MAEGREFSDGATCSDLVRRPLRHRMSADHTPSAWQGQRVVFSGKFLRVVCRDLSGADCDRVMAADAEDCGIAGHSRKSLVRSPRGEASSKARSAGRRPRLVVDEDYDLIWNDSAVSVNLGDGSFDPGELWVARRVQEDFTAYHGVDPDEAIANVRLVVQRAIENGSYRRTRRGLHLFSWRAFYVAVTPDLDVAVRYQTHHYERTPRQVADGVRSRVSQKGGRAASERIVPDRLAVGDHVEGVVSNVLLYGAFVKIADRCEGLLHRTQLAEPADDATMVLQQGDLLRVEVVSIDREAGHVGLRQLQDTWPDAESR